MDTQSWRAKANYFEFRGHQIAYWTGSDEAARPLLMVHGFPTCAWDWGPVWETLEANHHLIACDMLGFGLSDKPRSGYSIHLQTDLQEALLAHLGIGAFDALVHDYGVSVGQELIARQQDGSGAAGLGQMVFLNGGIFPAQHRPVLVQKIGVSPFGFLLGWLNNRKLFGMFRIEHGGVLFVLGFHAFDGGGLLFVQLEQRFGFFGQLVFLAQCFLVLLDRELDVLQA